MLTRDDHIRKAGIPNMASGKWALSRWTWQDNLMLAWYGLDTDFSVRLYRPIAGGPVQWGVDFEQPVRETPTVSTRSTCCSTLRLATAGSSVDLQETSPYGVAVTTALPEMVIDPAAAGFDGDVLAPVPVTDAARRVLAFCTEPRSGWVTYHLAARSTHTSGLFDQVTTWSLLYANALAGRVDIEDVAGFSRDRRRDFAARVAAVPEDTDLHTMDDDGVATVVNLCHFGYHGVWGPKITKMGALYRPHAVPVLDGHVAEVFGFNREGFSNKARQHGLDRRERIDKVVRALAIWIRIHRAEIAALRDAVTPTVPEIHDLPDLQLIDIVLWTSQDDKPIYRRPGQGKRWIDRPVGQHVTAEELRPEPIPAAK